MRFENLLEKIRPSNLLINLQSKSLAEDIAASIDPEGLFAIRKAFRGQQNPMDFKYFNFEPWIRENVRRALKVDLLNKRRISILDIGTGFGYFPYVCGCWHGHTVKAIDIPGQKLYDAVTEFLGIDKKHYFIKKFEPVESLGLKFDLITCFLVAFDRPPDEEIWGPAEWDFFLTDIKENHLTETGQLFLRLNPIPRVNSWYLPGVGEIFKKHGAKVRGGEMWINK